MDLATGKREYQGCKEQKREKAFDKAMTTGK